MAAALSAAAPGRHAVSCRWDSAYVSGTVMSHAKDLPLAHGRSVAPSGRLPSCPYYYYYYFLAHQHKAAGRKTRLDIQNYYYYNNNRRFTAII